MNLTHLSLLIHDLEAILKKGHVVERIGWSNLVAEIQKKHHEIISMQLNI